MTRPLRVEFAGAVYYLTSRGNAKQAIFLDEKDFADFLDVLCLKVILQDLTPLYLYNDIHKRRGEMYFDKTKENKTRITNSNYFTFKWTSIFIL